jgi:hypothetical protein
VGLGDKCSMAEANDKYLFACWSDDIGFDVKFRR